MVSKLCLKFEKGGELLAEILPAIAPQTVKIITKSMVINSRCFHTRWCGREIYTPFETVANVPKENQTSTANIGDVTFWRDWESEQADGVISVYYGAERIRYHTGDLQVNVFARIPQTQWAAIKEIGERIWQKGIERIEVDIL